MWLKINYMLWRQLMCTARHQASALISCIISWYQHEYSENKTDLNCFSSELILLLAWSGECRKWILTRQFIWSDILIRFFAGVSDPDDSVYTLTDPPPPPPYPFRRLMTVVLHIFCWFPSNSLFIPKNTRLLCYLEIFILIFV